MLNNTLLISFVRAEKDNVLFFDIFLHVDRQAVKIKKLHLKRYVAFNKYLIELRQLLLGGLLIAKNCKVKI